MVDKKVRIVPVKEISRVGEAILVEWNDGKALHRATIPVDLSPEQAEITVDSEILGVAKDVLEKGIPYGVPWLDVLKLSANLPDLVDGLHNAGIWTSHDVQTHARELHGIIQAFYGVDVAAVITVANTYKEVKHG